MTYCRIAIDTDARGRIYRKDFEAHHVFGALARAEASVLVTQGVVPEGAHYRAVVYPRYDSGRLDAERIISDGTAAEPPTAGPAADWLTLLNDAPALSDQPLRFFTLELHFPDHGLIYTRDCSILEIEPFWSTLQSALLKMRVLAEGDVYTPRIFTCSDGEADLYREEVRLLPEEDGAALIELVDSEPPETDFPCAGLDAFDVIAVHDLAVVSAVELAAMDEDRQDALQVVVAEPVLRALQHMAAQDVGIEQGGMLVGRVYRQSANSPQYLVAISDIIAAQGAEASLIELRYTFESWQRSAAALREQFPGKQIVGWYHTHLVSVGLATGHGEVKQTELFFSDDDRFMHRRFFSDPWYVAMVLAPDGQAAFFRWFDGKISANRRFYVVAAAALPPKG